MSTAHTPGPWVVFAVRNQITLEDARGNEITPSDADLNTLAAAPEMLEVLQMLCDANAIVGFSYIKAARAAIAKATGGGK